MALTTNAKNHRRQLILIALGDAPNNTLDMDSIMVVGDDAGHDMNTTRCEIGVMASEQLVKRHRIYGAAPGRAKTYIRMPHRPCPEGATDYGFGPMAKHQKRNHKVQDAPLPAHVQANLFTMVAEADQAVTDPALKKVLQQIAETEQHLIKLHTTRDMLQHLATS